MSDDKIVVEIQQREVLGKGLAKMRGDGQVPGVIHKNGKNSVHVMGNAVELNKAYARAGKRQPVTLKLDGKPQLAIIKDVDFEPAKRTLRHVVFQSIKQNEKVAADIPVVLIGEEIPAEIAGHMVLTQLDMVKVEALPKDLPEKLEIDATGLAEVGDRLTVADLKVPEGVTILSESEQSLAVVEMPKDQLAEANAAAEALAEDAAAKDEEAEAEKTGEPDESKESAEEPSESQEEKPNTDS